ncbi:hypothetical protein ABZT03_09605 [Streptomyces sp. NPDC005574]|uniref:hypothetical protein n=1 Tax=Streptomyces sp. NPDC005574 TaxID=3156891 RepID=UPI0033B0F5DE
MAHHNKHRISRRRILQLTGGPAAAGAVGGEVTAHAAPDTFTHPGMLHNEGDLNRARARVAAGDDPRLAG